MAKNFPYFKFVATEWLTGDIVFEELKIQGLFINICALYWQRDGKLSLDDIKKRYKYNELIEQLNGRFYTVKDGLISIKFLDEQLMAAGHLSKVNSDNGKKGAEAKRNKATAKRPLSESKQRKEEKEEEKEEEENKNNKFNAKAYMCDLGYDEKLVSEWFEVRKLKKLKNTETALKSFHKEVMQAKTNINDVLKTCVEKSWGGFKADWIKPANEPKKEVSPILMK